ncbi:MAG: hypothetical protein AAB460_01585 [Patescibacteria group bacterium]
MTLLKKICPICALVSLTWMTMLTFKGLGYDIDDALLAMLMGGSVVGISYVLGARTNLTSRVALMYWKLVAIPTGFAVMYALLQFAWGYFAGALVAYSVAWWLFKSASTAPRRSLYMEGITKELNNCCE